MGGPMFSQMFFTECFTFLGGQKHFFLKSAAVKV